MPFGMKVILGGFGFMVFNIMVYGDSKVTDDMRIIKTPAKPVADYNSIKEHVNILNESKNGKIAPIAQPKITEVARRQSGDFKKIDVAEARKQKEERLAEAKRIR